MRLQGPDALRGGLANPVLPQPTNVLAEAAREATLAHLAEQLAALSDGERAAIVQAMDLLRPIFVRGPKDTN